MKSERLNREFDCQITHVGLFPDDEGKRLQDKWVVVIEGQMFDYFTGIGRRKHKFGANSCQKMFAGDCLAASWKNPISVNVQRMIEHDTKAVPPTLDDVLYCLPMDAGAGHVSFADWCSDFGYDTDSRKALSIYEACQKNADKVRKFIPDLEKAREAFQDY